MNIKQAVDFIGAHIAEQRGVTIHEAWQTLKAAVLTQQTNNSTIVQLLCDCQDVICHSVFLDDKGHSALMDRINAVVAQLEP